MDRKYENVIKKQDELITAFRKQHADDQLLIHSQKQQIRSLHEKIGILEKENRELMDAGNEVAATCEKLEKVCRGQQELLESFSKLFPGR